MNIPTANNVPEYYDSEYYGEQIDEAVGKILSGEIEDYATRAEEAAEKAEEVAVKTPYINENGDWMTWDSETGAYTDSGVQSRGDIGPVGPPGPQGADGSLLDLGTGVFAMSVSPEGHLILSVNEQEEVPPLEINEQGHLIYKITS